MTMKVLFFSDSREFGGHESLTTSALHYMANRADLDVGVVYYERNVRLREVLRKIAENTRLNLYPLPLKSEGPRPFRPILWASHLPCIYRWMKLLSPDVLVVAQGNIEIGCLGVVAGKKAGLHVISYIPFAHSLADSGGPLNKLRAMIDRRLYCLPDEFITSSRTAKKMLQEWGVRTTITVIPNGIDLRSIPSDRAKKREAYGLSDSDFVAAVIGRIAFGQKGQDFLVKAIATYREQLQGILFWIIGDGPDTPKLRDLIRELRIEDRVRLIPWSTDIYSFYSAINLLLIPSLFEGLPQVMIEAMWYGRPIVASNIDGMAEVLPREWLFRRGDSESLVETLLRMRSADNSRYVAAHKRRVIEEFSMTSFQQRFCTAVIESDQF